MSPQTNPEPLLPRVIDPLPRFGKWGMHGRKRKTKWWERGTQYKARAASVSPEQAEREAVLDALDGPEGEMEDVA